MTDRRRLLSSRARVSTWALALAVLFATAASTTRADSSWIKVPSPTTQTLWGVGANASVYVAVGEAGTILSSPDAATWTARTSGTDRWLLSVAWSPTLALFVAVGDSGTLLTSPDGANWTPRSSGTTQRLNAVLWGGGVFLVVGENGTALTSTDTLTWTPRTTGDTGWLRGLAYGNGLFLVTGHDGTLLTTADAGATFQRRHIATTEGINAATFAEDRFVVFWSDFNSASSTDAAFWSIEHAQLPPNTSHFGVSAATSLGSTLLAAGDNGHTRPQSYEDSSIIFHPIIAFSSIHWRAAASGPDKFVLVGTGGTIVTAPFSALGVPTVSIDVRTARSTPVAGAYLDENDLVELHASLGGARATSWRWTLNDTPITGASSPDLSLGRLTPARTGRYRATALGAAGSEIATNTAVLTLPVDTPTLGLIDQSFHPALPATPDAIAPLADGRIYVAAHDVFFNVNGHETYGLARLRADGSVDPSFDAGTGLDYGGVVTDFIPLPSGQLIVRGTFTMIDGVHAPTLLRLNADGSLDTSFQPDPKFRDSTTRPILLADGRWLVATPAADGAQNRTVALARFRADGSADGEFSPPAVSFAAPVSISDAGRPNAIVSTRLPDGRIYLSVLYGYINTHSLAGRDSGKSLLFRLSADGSPDPTFVVRSFDEIGFLQATSRGLICLTRRYYTVISGTWNNSLFRLQFDGTPDPSFPKIAGGIPGQALTRYYQDHERLSILADESIVAQEGTIHGGIVRFTPDGERDADFSADHEIARTAITVDALANGQILVTPPYVRSSTGGLVRLTPARNAAQTRLVNLSVRASVHAGEGGLIAGFVTTHGAKKMLARAIGPSLADYNLSGWLPDPQLRLVHAGTTLLANNNWAESGSVYLAKTFARVGAFPLAPTSLDAAASGSITAGASTLEVSDPNGTSGIVLAELYDADDAPADAAAPRLVNLSARAQTGSDNDTLIAGFTLAGPNVRSLLIRAIGPSLATLGIAHPLPDPVLTLHRSDGTTITTSTATEEYYNFIFANKAAVVGAFPLPAASANLDAQLAVTLPPGSYSATVHSATSRTGIALIEIYEIP